MATRAVQDALLNQLKDPFDPKFVKWRVGATNADKTLGIALAYIDSREVKKRLDEVMGLAGWRDRLIPVDGGFISEIDLNIDGEWITRSNAAGNTAVEAIKGGASDAFKRAASKWGVGHYLYYLPNQWVPIKPAGKSYALAQTPELPSWALPGGVPDWESVAEMEASLNSGVDDELFDQTVDNLDLVRASKSEEELNTVLEDLSSDQKLLLANQIAAKRRELSHADRIHANSDNSTTEVS